MVFVHEKPIKQSLLVKCVWIRWRAMCPTWVARTPDGVQYCAIWAIDFAQKTMWFPYPFQRGTSQDRCEVQSYFNQYDRDLVWSTHHQGLRTSLHFHLSNLVYRCLYLLWLFALIYIYLHAFASIIISYIKHLIIFTLICICMFIYLHLLTCIFALIYMYYLLYLLS